MERRGEANGVAAGTRTERAPRVEGGDVSYRLDEVVDVVRLPQAPGSNVLAQDGRVRFEPVTRDGGCDVVAASG